MNKQEEIEKLKQVLVNKIKSENDSRYDNLSSDENMKIIIESSNKGKYVFWVLREYLKGNIQRFEDIEARCKQALILFKNNLSKFTEQQKQLNKLSFQELEMLVEPYQDVLTQNAIKRMNKEKIWSEIETIYEGPEGKIYSPKTKEASIFLGQGTKWCTASTDNNMFDYYNNHGNLYVFILPEKDEQGREIKYQLHFESSQFMDIQDNEIQCSSGSCLSELFGILVENLSMKQKIKHFFGTDYDFSVSFGFSSDLENILFMEKLKIAFNSNKLNKIPEKFMTEKLCELAVKQDGLSLRFIPGEFKNKDMCELAVQNGLSLYYVPKEFKTPELCKIAIQQNGSALYYVPQELRTKELYESAVKQNGSALWHIPEELRTKELCELAVTKNGLALSYVPEELLTQELYELAVIQNGMALDYVPQELRTKELYESAVKQNGISLQYVPNKLTTNELCELAVKQNGCALKYVPAKFKTKEFCELAVQNNGKALIYVPKEFRIKKLCELAVQQNGKSLCYVPNELKTEKLCKIAIQQNGRALEYVPEEFKTPELCELAMRQDGSAFQHIPTELRTKELLEIYIKEENNRNNINYSFEEILEMVFSFENNRVKEIFKNIKTHLQQYYIELRSEQLSLDFELTKKHIF